MTGVLYSREPEAENTDDIHLWEMEGDVLRSSCGEFEFEIVDNSHSSVLIESENGVKKIVRVTQKESYKQANSGYCDECLQNHPKLDAYN